MELSGIKFLLIYLSPVALFAVLMFFLILLLSPLINRQFDSQKPIEKELKDKLKADRELIEEGIQKGNISCEEIATHLKQERRLIKEGLGRIWRARREESGWNDFMKASRIDINVDISIFWFFGSVLFTPLGLFFIVITGLSNIFFQLLGMSAQSELSTTAYLFLLILPAIGFWLAHRGYKRCKKRLALMLCLLINTIYAGSIIYVIFQIGHFWHKSS